MRTTIFSFVFCLLLLQLAPTVYAQPSALEEAKRSREFMLAWSMLHSGNASTVVSNEKDVTELKKALSSVEDYPMLLLLAPDNITVAFHKDSLLAIADRSYIKKQLNKTQAKSWSKKDLPGLSIADEKEIRACFKKREIDNWAYFKKKFHALSITSLSNPVFSLDGNVALIYEGTSCGGLCGEGDIVIYVFLNRRWQELEHVRIWIS